MNKPVRWEALPDEHIEEEETVCADELFQDIMAGFEAIEQHTEGEIKLRVTEFEMPALQNHLNTNKSSNGTLNSQVLITKEEKV